MYYVYLAKSLRNRKLYVGFTNKEPAIRVSEHNRGSNQWSRSNKPFMLVYYESFVCKTDALLREKFFKTGVGKRVKYAIVKEFDKGP